MSVGEVFSLGLYVQFEEKKALTTENIWLSGKKKKKQSPLSICSFDLVFLYLIDAER